MKDYGNLFTLTPEQQKAFNKLKKALKDCEKLNMMFYNNYGTLGVTDKAKIDKYDDTPTELFHGDIYNPNEIRLPCNEWADDRHYFHINNQ